ncbi:acetyltransferase [Arthrobacter yangruifuii]|uniref:acetyltransferase n=1 Tax=Arthrobacter yangruifuii TaxID=2606616 RepID=UPI001FEFF82D|nr:acetyltransferase [Arthrobacter yangruifuii]
MLRDQPAAGPPDGGTAETLRLPPVIDLSRAPGSGEAWGRPRPVVYLWSACELVFLTNPWQISSRLRVAVLRAFGAEIADGVVFRPRTRVKAPWKLHIGARSWIGEGVWFHNQDHIYVGSDVVISQETFLTTGSHRVRTDMGLVTSPIRIDDGAWITSRCMVLGGAGIGRSAVIQPMTVVKGTVPPGQVLGSASGPTGLGERFPSGAGGSTPEREER